MAIISGTVFAFVLTVSLLPRDNLADYSLELTSRDILGRDDNRLYLGFGRTTVLCSLNGTETPASPPPAPFVVVYNRTWSTHFTFTVIQDSLWQLNLSRGDIGLADEVAQWWPKEEWRLFVNTTVDNSPVTASASLLDTVADVFLHWAPGSVVTTLPAGLPSSLTRVQHSPCAPDVAVIATKSTAAQGFFLARTYGSFQTDTVTWYQLTSAQVCPSVCTSSTQLVDVLLTNHHLFVLTTEGLHRSNDFRIDTVSGSGTQLTFSTVFTVSDHLSSLQNIHVSYSKTCQSRQHDLQTTRGDLVAITLESTSGDDHSFYAEDPFTSWHEAQPSRMTGVNVTDSCHNQHTNSLTLLLTSTQSGVNSVEVIRLGSDILPSTSFFPPFDFPASAQITRLQFLSTSHLLYAYGNQVWVSGDGGNSFTLIHSLATGMATSMQIDVYEKVFIMETDSGDILLGRPGVNRLIQLPFTITPSTTVLSIDALSRLIEVTVTLATPSVSAQMIDTDNHVKNANTTSTRPLAIVFLSHKKALLYEHQPLGSPTLTPSVLTSFNIGKEIVAKDGGTGTILAVRGQQQQLMAGFVSAASVRLTSTWNKDTTTAGPHKHTLSISFNNRTSGTATLTLSSLVVNSEGWTADDVSKTVVIPGTASFLITQFTSAASVEATAVTYTRVDIARHQGSWFMVNLGVVSGISTWMLHEPACIHRMVLKPSQVWRSIYELDLHESVSLVVLLNNSDIYSRDKPPKIYTTLSNPRLFKTDFKSELLLSTNQQQINTSLKSYYFTRGVTAVRFHIDNPSLRCVDPFHTVLVYSGCPCQKRLVFVYPFNLTDAQYLSEQLNDAQNDSYLSTLVVNYRPPSQLGVGIPTNKHIYHADPEQERPNNVYHISKSTGDFKQCLGAANRSQCGCTDLMKLSSHPHDSDCKQRVFHVLHPGVLKTHFILQQLGRADMRLPDSFLVRLSEINDRAPTIDRWASSTSPVPEILKGVLSDDRFTNIHSYFDPNSLQLVMNGSGLYHYKAEVHAGLSFCDLSVYFLLYVDQTPIPYPLQYILNFSMSIIFGTFFLVLYLWSLNNNENFSTHRIKSVPVTQEDDVQALYVPL